MSIAQALNSSLSGLRATQAGLSLIAANVANAQTPDYLRKTLSLAALTGGGIGGGVRIVAINRELEAAPTPTCGRASISGCSRSTASPGPTARSRPSSTGSPAPCSRW